MTIPPYERPPMKGEEAQALVAKTLQDWETLKKNGTRHVQLAYHGSDKRITIERLVPNFREAFGVSDSLIHTGDRVECKDGKWWLIAGEDPDA